MAKQDTVAIAQYESIIKQIQDRSNPKPLLQLIYKEIGYTQGALSNWKRNGMVPRTIIWALKGYLAQIPLPQTHKDLVKTRPEFSLEELRELIALIMTSDASPKLTKKAAVMLLAIL